MNYAVIKDMQGIDKYSFSKLNSFHGCKYGYKLTYIDKIRGSGNGFSDLGSYVHSILEDYLNGEIEQFEMVSKFEEDFDENVPDGVELKISKTFSRDLTTSYKTQCAEFLDEFEGFDGYDVVGVEENFDVLFQIKDKVLQLSGFIDAVIQDKDGEIVIVDFKSKSKFKGKDEIKEYARQLYMYSIWIKHKYGKFPKELWFVQFRINHTEKIIFKEEDFAEMLDWIYNTAEEIDTEQFYEPSCDEFFANNLCGHSQYCPYAKLY